MLLTNHVESFVLGARKARTSTAKAKLRLSKEQFDALADYACVFCAVINAARNEHLKDVSQQLHDAFMRRLGFTFLISMPVRSSLS